MLVARLGVAIAVDQLPAAPLFQDRSTLTLELAQAADRKVSVSLASRPMMVSVWPLPGFGIAVPPVSRPNVPKLWVMLAVVVVT